MKSFLNFIRKNGLYAFINLFGLTVSLAFARRMPTASISMPMRIL